MPQYVVRQGYTFGAFDQLGPGDLVELSEREAEGFLDKLQYSGPASIGPGEGAVVVTDDEAAEAAAKKGKAK